MNKCPTRDLKCPYSLTFPDIDSPLPCCATQKQCDVFLKENPKG